MDLIPDMFQGGIVMVCQLNGKIEEKFRQKGQNKDEVPVNELRKQCRAFASEWVDIQKKNLKGLV